MFNSHNIILGGSIIPAVMPVDLGDNAATGPWANMRDFVSMEVFLAIADGVAGNGPILQLEQATSSAGAGAKPLSITELWTKVAADLLVRDEAVGFVDWVKSAASRTNPLASFDTDDVGGDTDPMLALIRIHEGTLDNGFTHVRFKMAAAGGNRLGYVLYLGQYKEYAGKTLPTLLK